MISWEKYLSTVVETFRTHYDKMTNEEKDAAQLNMTFIKPCQIEFFSFKDDGQIMLVTLFPNSPDEIIVHKNLGKDFDFHSVLGERFREILPNIKKLLSEYIRDGKVRRSVSWASLTENGSIYTYHDLQKAHPHPRTYGQSRFAEVNRLLKDNLRSRARSTKVRDIEEQVKGIRLGAGKIQDKSLRAKMLEHTNKISSSILDVKKLEQHEQRLHSIEQEIGGVRKMIGTTKEYQDFRVFIADLEKLKESHVHKEVFQSEIKRLDQRIEDLKAIKFWSKRTFLEIALAIMAVIATLYGAGVIKF